MEIKKIYKNGKEIEVGYREGKFMWFENMNFFSIIKLYAKGCFLTKEVSEVVSDNGYLFKIEKDHTIIEVKGRTFKEWIDNNGNFKSCEIK